MKRIATALVLALCATTAGANDLSKLYTQQTLEYWGRRYERGIYRMLDNTLWPALRSDEKERLGGAPPQLELPLWAQGEARQYPLAYYVTADHKHIVLPVLSLKFLDDMCTAMAWLVEHGDTLETLSEYTAILRYGQEPAGGFPPPLPALGIPQDALKDSRVDAFSSHCLSTAVAFILLHEMGHVALAHESLTGESSVRQEQQADRFAVDVMERAGLLPLGVIVIFMVDAHWAGLPTSSAEATHPLSGARVQALAEAVDVPSVRMMLQQMGQQLDDPQMRAFFIEIGRSGDLSTLKPRRGDELGRLPPAGKESREAVAFDGTYRGVLVQHEELPPTPMELVLERTGQHVKGRFSFGAGVGLITGTVEGSRLFFDWEWGDESGQGLLESQGRDTLSGTWGVLENREGIGTWTLRRVSP